MSANRMYLVCQHCPTQVEALFLANRPSGESQFTCSASQVKMDKWFARHQKCGGNSDKFTVAFERPKDWDLSPPAEPIAAAVRTELALSSLNGSDTEH